MDSEVKEPEASDAVAVSFGDDGGYMPFRVAEILPDKKWPENLVRFLENPAGGDRQGDRRMKLTEITALLCHVAMIEVGFFPSHVQVEDFEEVWRMSDYERIRRFAAIVDSAGYDANGVAYSWSYYALEFVEQKTENGEVIPEKYSLKPSSKLSVVFLAETGNVKLIGNFGDRDAGKSFHLCKDVDIRKYLERETIPAFHTMNLKLSEWMTNLRLSGAKFAAAFKKDFAFLCMDSVDGISFERKNVDSLSTEILAHIFSYCDVRTIRSARLTCKKFNEVANVPQLWLFLLNRDFGPLTGLEQKFSQLTQRRPSTRTLSENLSDPAHDYRVLYQLERMSGLSRSYSVGIIEFPRARIYRRMPPVLMPSRNIFTPPPSVIFPRGPLGPLGPAAPHRFGPHYPFPHIQFR